MQQVLQTLCNQKPFSAYITSFLEHLAKSPCIQDLGLDEKKELIWQNISCSPFLQTQYKVDHTILQDNKILLDAKDLEMLVIPRFSYGFYKETTESESFCMMDLKKNQLSQDCLGKLFGFFPLGNSILIEIYCDLFYAEIYALQYALSALLCGFRSVDVVCIAPQANKQEVKNIQEAYKKILQNSATKYICYMKQEVFYNQINFHIYDNTRNIEMVTLPIAQPDINFRGQLLESSLLHSELTSYCNLGILYLALALLECRNATLEGKFCLLSGCDTQTLNLARSLYAIRAKPLTLSDSCGFVYDENGLDLTLIDNILGRHGDCKESWLPIYAKERQCVFNTQKEQIFDIPAFAYFFGHPDYSLQSELAVKLLRNGCKCIGENIPSACYDAINLLVQSQIIYIPFIATNMSNIFVSYDGERDNEVVINSLILLLQGADELCYPTDIIMGIVRECCLQLQRNMK